MGKLVGLMLVVALAACSSPELKSDSGQTVSDERAQAADVCEGFVKQRLKAPATAEFRNPYGDQIVYAGDGKGPVTVSASVDSENGFGAKIRLPYVCVVSSAGGDRWTLDSLDIEED